MPELPEVETLRRGLERLMVGRTILAVELRLTKLFREGLATNLVGCRVVAVRRLAKFLIFDLDSNESLTIHLNLAGQVVLESSVGQRFSGGHPIPDFSAALPHKSTRLILGLDDGSTLYLTDIRTFASARLMARNETDEWLAAQDRGPDALADEIGAAAFYHRLQTRRSLALKPLLLDQRFLAGIGNIYADEALYMARLHPQASVASVSEVMAGRLYEAIRSVLDFAVEVGVAKVVNGKADPNALLPRVHGRRGEPCRQCGTTIEKIVVGNRGTYLCPTCQPLSVS